jgi:hypothetical protein
MGEQGLAAPGLLVLGAVCGSVDDLTRGQGVAVLFRQQRPHAAHGGGHRHGGHDPGDCTEQGGVETGG